MNSHTKTDNSEWLLVDDLCNYAVDAVARDFRSGARELKNFIHTTKNEIVVYLAADLPQRWRSKVTWDLYPGYIACWGKGEKHHLFNGHTFKEEYCRDEETHPQISKTNASSVERATS